MENIYNTYLIKQSLLFEKPQECSVRRCYAYPVTIYHGASLMKKSTILLFAFIQIVSLSLMSCICEVINPFRVSFERISLIEFSISFMIFSIPGRATKSFRGEDAT